MWANTVWGFFSSALDSFLATLGEGDPGVKKLLLGGTVLFAALSLATLLFPFVRLALNRVSGRKSLVIVFDPSNPAERFWSLENAPHPTEAGRPIAYLETRLEIRNQSNKTVRNVRVSVATSGALPSRPTFMPFDTSKTPNSDINPGCSELVPIIRWPHPRIRPGMFALESAKAYGPIEVVVSADDTPPAIRRFHFDYQKDPMIYD